MMLMKALGMGVAEVCHLLGNASKIKKGQGVGGG